MGQSTIPDKKLRDLIMHFSEKRLCNEDFEFPDLLGAAYEFLIRDFADPAGKKGGTSLRRKRGNYNQPGSASGASLRPEESSEETGASSEESGGSSEETGNGRRGWASREEQFQAVLDFWAGPWRTLPEIATALNRTETRSEPCTSGRSSPDGRWSACWRTILLPPRIVEYVAVHELVHLQHPHHTPPFWARVERVLPDFALRKARLAENGRLAAI